jgi:hypothetical protein
MKRVALTSTALLSAGYDSASRVLEVEFTNGTVYQYLDVEPEAYAALLEARSKGRFFRARIQRVFEFRRL